MTAAVVVTTPHRLSVVDVAKGVELLGALNVPTIALAENMAYFDADDGTRYPIFGTPVAAGLAAQYGIPHTVQFGISPVHADAVDARVPLVLANDVNGVNGAAVAAEAAQLQPYEELAAVVLQELEFLHDEGGAKMVRPSVSFDPYAGVAIREGAKSGSVPTHILRVSWIKLDLIPYVLHAAGSVPSRVVWVLCTAAKSYLGLTLFQFLITSRRIERQRARSRLRRNPYR